MVSTVKRRLLALTFAALLGSIALLAAQIISDDFNRADGTGLGANWTDQTNGMDISTNRAIARTATNQFNISVYTGASWTGGADQYAEYEIRQQGSSSDGGPMVRGSTSAVTGYACDVGDSSSVAVPGSLTIVALKFVASSFTAISSEPTQTVSVGDVIRTEVTGTGGTVTVTCKLNGATITSGTDTAGDRILSGKPGIFIFTHSNDSGTKNIIDNFAAGDFGAGSSPAPKRLMLLGIGN